MPPIAELHPVVVHFVVALGVAGIAFRILSLFPFGKWATHAATVLIVLAAAASALAVKSGDASHGPAERIPGARPIVQEHEELGEKARNILVALAALELIALALRKNAKMARGLGVASALVGLPAAALIYGAGKHGGELVYEYAGGVGTLKSDSADVTNLLVAGLFHQARLAREAGRKEEAARLTAELILQRPNDPTVALLGIESQLRDRADAAGAMTSLRAMSLPADQPMLAVRKGMLLADGYVALGHTDSARTLLTDLKAKFPAARGLQAAIDKLK
ncbi:MAG: hypothetical protein IT355_06900 [Gemmatimonadaceae bacterium]|nr:hypothetical protein [Gemmatimonadaceae bacterium]